MLIMERCIIGSQDVGGFTCVFATVAVHVQHM